MQQSLRLERILEIVDSKNLRELNEFFGGIASIFLDPRIKSPIDLVCESEFNSVLLEDDWQSFESEEIMRGGPPIMFKADGGLSYLLSNLIRLGILPVKEASENNFCVGLHRENIVMYDPQTWDPRHVSLKVKVSINREDKSELLALYALNSMCHFIKQFASNIVSFKMTREGVIFFMARHDYEDSFKNIFAVISFWLALELAMESAFLEVRVFSERILPTPIEFVCNNFKNKIKTMNGMSWEDNLDRPDIH